MPRIRTIKPDFFTSLTIADLTYEARLTFIGLWTHVDDQGRCVDDARLVKAAVWPLDERTAKDVDADLWELSDAELVYRYTVGAKKFLCVTSWAEHQKISHPAKAKLPAPEEGEPTPKAERPRKPSGGSPEDLGGFPERLGGVVEEAPEDFPRPRLAPEMPESAGEGDEEVLPYPGAVVLPMFTSENVPSGNPPEDLGGSPEDDGNPPRGKERKGKDLYSASAPSSPHGEGHSDAPSTPSGYDDPRFQQFWARYPHKVSKKKACTAFFKALKRTTFEQLMAGLECYLTQDRRALDGYVKDPATWLNGDCWDDEPLPRAANGGPAPTAPKRSSRNEWMANR